MADPRVVPPEQRRQKMSDLMRAKAQNRTGEKVNFCPFGCEEADLDDHGYCKHLVGFTNDQKNYEPMREGKNRDGSPAARKVFGNESKPVLKTDQLVQITTSYRVYRASEPAK